MLSFFSFKETFLVLKCQNLIKKYIFLLIGFFLPLLFWIIFLYRQFEAIKKYQWEMSWLGLGCSLILSSIYFIMFALNWSIILKKISKKNSSYIPVLKSMKAWLFTIMSRYVPGNVWHIMGRMTFSGELNTGKTEIFASSAVEQLVALIGATFLFLVSLPFWPIKLLGEDLVFKIGIILVLFFAGLTILHPVFLSPILNWMGEKLKRPELRSNFNYSEILYFTMLYFISSLIMGFVLVTVIKGFGEVVFPHLLYIIGSSALAWVIGYISFITPSGIGVREGVLTALLGMVYPIPVAIVASLLFRIVCTLGEFFAIFVFTVFMKIKQEKLL